MKKALFGIITLFCALGAIYYGIYHSKVVAEQEADTAYVDVDIVIPDSIDTDSTIFQVDSICKE